MEKVLEKSDIANMLTQPLVAHWTDEVSPMKPSSRSWPTSPFTAESDGSSAETFLRSFVSPGAFSDIDIPCSRQVTFEEREIEVLGGSSLLTSSLLMVQSMIGGGRKLCGLPRRGINVYLYHMNQPRS
jgi:hypothetical protein